jgi:hypothetical protein
MPTGASGAASHAKAMAQLSRHWVYLWQDQEHNILMATCWGEMTMLKLVLTASVAASAVAGCAQAGQTDMVALRMAATVLKYVDTCENRSAPQYYVDKAKRIWDSASASCHC